LGKYQTTSKKESNNRTPHHIPYNNSFHQGMEPRIRAANAAARTKHPAKCQPSSSRQEFLSGNIAIINVADEKTPRLLSRRHDEELFCRRPNEDLR
jgi:hypothetical protein